MFTDDINEIKNAAKKTERYIQTLQEQIEILSTSKNKSHTVPSLLCEIKKLTRAIELANKKMDLLFSLNEKYNNLILKSQIEQKDYSYQLNQIERKFLDNYSIVRDALL